VCSNATETRATLSEMAKIVDGVTSG
jgi:hypothetical protein